MIIPFNTFNVISLQSIHANNPPFPFNPPNNTLSAATGETDAVKISELLPFVEFDVQKQLMLKMKVAGMNACFGYECKIQVGSGMVIAMATCTAVCLEALPPSPTLHFLKTQRDPGARIGVEQDGRLVKMQRDLEVMFQVREGRKEGGLFHPLIPFFHPLIPFFSGQ